MSSCLLVAGENIPLVLPAIEKELENVIEQWSLGERTLSSVMIQLVTGHAQLWLYSEDTQLVGWAVTEIVAYDTTNRLRFVLAGGAKLESWFNHFDEAVEWSKQHGCTGVEAYVRPGLRKVLEKHGFRKTYEVVTKLYDNARTLN